MSIFNGTADDIFNKKTDYPVGSVCMFNTNIDPNEMYGGTWVRIKGKFIFGADDDTYPLGSEGGEAAHTLTVDEIPSHRHPMYFYNEGGNLADGNDYVGDRAVPFNQAVGSRETHWHQMLQAETGGNQPHNNMPPYVAFYIWAKVS